MKKYFYNDKFKLVNLINLDKANANYLAPISPILFSNFGKLFYNYNYYYLINN